MAEGRMIKKRISRSIKFSKLKSNTARLLYLMIYPHLDVKGRMEANPKLIKGEVCPLLCITYSKISLYLRDMHNVGLIKLYKADDGQEYLECSRFLDFQTVREDREAISRIPKPKPTPEQLRESSGVSLSKVKGSKYIYPSFSVSNNWYKSLKKEYPDIDVDFQYERFKNWLQDHRCKNHKGTFRNWLNNEKPNKGKTSTKKFSDGTEVTLI